jgi:hypothetical protein
MKIGYKVNNRSAVSVRIGIRSPYIDEKHGRLAYDLSRFNRITFFLKGEKDRSFLSRPNKLFAGLVCYSQMAKSKNGKQAQYYNRSEIIPDRDWKKIEIPFDDFVPSKWTQNNVSNYPPNPDMAKVLQIFFLVSSFQGDHGHPGSNTIWLDEIVLQ